VFDLLTYLVRNRDRVVSKEDLIASVWGGRIVSDSTLTSRINAARKAVGDSGEEQKLIRTIARKGLRFVGAVSTRSNGDAPASAFARLSGPCVPEPQRPAPVPREHTHAIGRERRGPSALSILLPPPQLRISRVGGATTRTRAIMPPSSCSRIWQWNTKSPICVNGTLTHTDWGLQAPLA
jgi:DNA-binding winged helix-turn-helix (wHTH) protein